MSLKNSVDLLSACLFCLPVVLQCQSRSQGGTSAIQITAPDGITQFGQNYLEVFGDRLIIGGYSKSQGRNILITYQLRNSGAAELHRMDATGQIGLSSSLLTACSPGDNFAGIPSSGKATVYAWKEKAWQRRQALAAAEPRENEMFCFAVAASDRLVAVNSFPNANSGDGSVHVFARSDSGLYLVGSVPIEAKYKQPGAAVAQHIAVSNSALVLSVMHGQAQNNVILAYKVGDDGIIEFDGELAPFPGDTSVKSLRNVALHGNTVAYTFTGGDPAEGYVGVFYRDPNGWQRGSNLTPSKTARPYPNPNGLDVTSSGVAACALDQCWVFSESGIGKWSVAKNYTFPNASADSIAGVKIAADGDVVAVASRVNGKDPADPGIVHLFGKPRPRTTPDADMPPPDAPPVEAAVPTPIRPQGETTVDANRGRLPLLVSWQHEPAADAYEVEVVLPARPSCSDRGISLPAGVNRSGVLPADKHCASGACYYAAPAFQARDCQGNPYQYKWRVRARAGTTSTEWSEEQWFSLR